MANQSIDDILAAKQKDNIEIFANEREKPYYFFSGAENTGNELIGNQRIFAGFQLGNILNQDHLATYQYTTSNEFDTLQAHYLNYSLPSPFDFRHLVSIEGAYSNQSLDIPLRNTNGSLLSEGTSYQLSPSYKIPLYKSEMLKDNVIRLGYDFKGTNSNLEFSGAAILTTEVETHQFWIEQTFTTAPLLSEDWWSPLHFEQRLVISPGDLSSRNDDRNYNQLRSLSSSDYTYWTGGIRSAVWLPTPSSSERMDKNLNPHIRYEIEGIISDSNLLSAEALSLGGSRSIRGFEENAILIDQGFRTSLELHSTPFSIGNHLNKWAKKSTQADLEQPKEQKIQFDDKSTLFAFFDYGIGGSKDRLAGESASFSIGSIGVGLEFSLNDNWSGNINYGHQVISDNFTDGNEGRLNLSIQAFW